jgi:phosphatidylglycerophosphate synthase
VRAIVVCSASSGDPTQEVGGLTLLERLIRQLSDAGIFEVVLVTSPVREIAAPVLPASTTVTRRRSDAGDPWAMAGEAAQGLSGRWLIVGADYLVDDRLLQRLSAATEDTGVRRRRSDPAEVLGTFSAGTIGRPMEWLVVDELPTYWRARRGEVPVHLLRVRSADDRARAWSVLLDHIEKRTKDLPAEWFDPPVENWVLRRIAPTAVTPNQVTVLTGVLGFVVTWCFWSGRLASGVLLAIAVEVLDGVDGKLARLKRATTPQGEIEHVLDFFYENSWYLALGSHLSAAGAPWAWPAGIAFTAFDLIDNLAYLLFERRYGRPLEESWPFLRRFRLVAGRRNVYVWTFLPGFLLGFPRVVFALAACWAGVTVAVHVAVALATPPAVTEPPEDDPERQASRLVATAEGQMPLAPERLRPSG